MHTLLPEFFQDSDQQFLESNFTVASPEDIFGILEALDGVSTSSEFNSLPPLNDSSHLCPVIDAGDLQQPETTTGTTTLVSQKSIFSFNTNHIEGQSENEVEEVNLHKSKKQKVGTTTKDQAAPNLEGQQQKVSHITVERNRRKQMNENLTVLRSLMPCFYVKKGDQASIVGGVVDYITELHQVLQSLEAKKQRKFCSEILSPRLVQSSPRNIAISPRKPPLSPRLISSLPISPTTPQPSSPYKHHSLLTAYLSPTIMSPSNSSTTTSIDNELVANSKSGVADVEVKFSGSNLLLKTVSARIPGQALKIISALEDLSFEILNVSLSTIDETMINSFTIKIGIDCQLSADDLALYIQQTFW